MSVSRATDRYTLLPDDETFAATAVALEAPGSQLATYAWGAANVIVVVGAQKLVPDLIRQAVGF
jgi:hypothetical protein